METITDANIGVAEYYIKEYWKTKANSYYQRNKERINERRRKKYAQKYELTINSLGETIV